MRTNTRLIDPIHFFNERGQSILSLEAQAMEIHRLQEENGELKRRLTAMYQRLKACGSDDEEEDH